MDFDSFDAQLAHPSSIIISSPSGGGKSHLACNLLNNADKVFQEPISRIIFVCAHHQEIYKNLSKKYDCVYLDKLEECEPFLIENAILLVDDLLDVLDTPQGSKYITSFFTRRVHHSKVTCILLLQTLFSKHLRTCFVNTTYLFVERWIKNVSSVQVLARQFRPQKAKEVLKCYEDATKEPYSFLLMDFNVLTPDKFRIRSGVFPFENIKIYEI